VAVRTHDIALGGLGEDPLDPRASNHPSYADPLVAPFAMVEINRARRKSPATVGTRHAPQVIENLRLPGPAASPLLEALRNPRGYAVAQPFLVLSPCTDSMADSAYHITLRNLSEEAAAGATQRRRAG